MLAWKWFQIPLNKRNLELNVKCQLKQLRNSWQLSLESLVPHFCSFILINTAAMGSYLPFLLLINLDFQMMSNLGASWTDFFCPVHNSPSSNVAFWFTCCGHLLVQHPYFKFSCPIAFYQHLFWHLLPTTTWCISILLGKKQGIYGERLLDIPSANNSQYRLTEAQVRITPAKFITYEKHFCIAYIFYLWPQLNILIWLSKFLCFYTTLTLFHK